MEAIFARFRGIHREECPEWQFSCNAEGESLLRVFEIVCPLEMDEDSDEVLLKELVDEGVESLTGDQVEIFGEYIRVLMYSEEEAWAALDWLGLNGSDSAPEEIGWPCSMNETMWNLNELYGDYVPPGGDESDQCATRDFWVSLAMWLVAASLWNVL